MTDFSPAALLVLSTIVRMKAGVPTTGEVVGCWPVHPGTERMVALHGEWVRGALALPTAKVAWSDGEVTVERVTDLRVEA